MCNTNSDSPNVCSSATCLGRCTSKLATGESLQAALATLQAATDALDGLPAPVQAALRTIMSNTEVSLKLRQAKGTRADQGATVFIRRLKRRTDDGPISGEAIARRMMDLCGCQGQYDCDCVPVENQARRELWQAHNAGVAAPTQLERHPT